MQKFPPPYSIIPSYQHGISCKTTKSHMKCDKNLHNPADVSTGPRQSSQAFSCAGSQIFGMRGVYQHPHHKHTQCEENVCLCYWIYRILRFNISPGFPNGNFPPRFAFMWLAHVYVNEHFSDGTIGIKNAFCKENIITISYCNWFVLEVIVKVLA